MYDHESFDHVVANPLPSQSAEPRNPQRVIQESRPSNGKLPLIIVVEGRNDVEFLRRISTILHVADDDVPNLRSLEHRGKLLFVPAGGGELQTWACRLAPLKKAEFHLYDLEASPASELHLAAVQLVNSRRHCRAALTSKRSLENYLHPEAIFEVSGIQIEVNDHADVAELVARQRFLSQHPKINWIAIAARCRARLRNSAKRWLNRAAVDRMTVDRLATRDPTDEIRGWLATIAEMMAYQA
jgi:hypothetical protein